MNLLMSYYYLGVIINEPEIQPTSFGRLNLKVIEPVISINTLSEIRTTKRGGEKNEEEI